MLGWTVLLLWACRKPAERRDVLLLTCVVVVALMITGLFGITVGYVPFGAGVAVLAFQGLLIILFGSSYLASKRQHS
jgi:Mg2+ and Co2+ transporter CorA